MNLDISSRKLLAFFLAVLLFGNVVLLAGCSYFKTREDLEDDTAYQDDPVEEYVVLPAIEPYDVSFKYDRFGNDLFGDRPFYWFLTEEVDVWDDGAGHYIFNIIAIALVCRHSAA